MTHSLEKRGVFEQNSTKDYTSAGTSHWIVSSSHPVLWVFPQTSKAFICHLLCSPTSLQGAPLVSLWWGGGPTSWVYLLAAACGGNHCGAVPPNHSRNTGISRQVKGHLRSPLLSLLPHLLPQTAPQPLPVFCHRVKCAFSIPWVAYVNSPKQRQE